MIPSVYTQLMQNVYLYIACLSFDTNTYTHDYMHTYIHTYICIYTSAG